MSAEYEAVIGLETHIQLNTLTKIFCACLADSWGAPPNTNICPVCSGLPGVLPVLNQAVVEKGLLLARAVHADISAIAFFDRKNYFYPDLPKGYQISQFDMPLAKGGYLDVPIPSAADPQGQGYLRRVKIRKLHLEEDAGKTRRQGNRRLVDFNRCGVPLVEMVTEPDLHNADEAAQYVLRLRQLLRWIGISEADMERGNLRCDANVSIRPLGSQVLNEKTEIKNLNSIESLRDAIGKEIGRQARAMDAGERVAPWTLEWDEDAAVLRKMRSKESEADYRYFREPDLLSLEISPQRQERVLADFPELPLERRARFMREYELPEYDADLLTQERELSDYFESALKHYKGEPKKVSNWLLNDVARLMNDLAVRPSDLKLTPAFLAELVTLVDSGVINLTTAKSLLPAVHANGNSPGTLVREKGLAQVRDDAAIRSVCLRVLERHPDEVAAYRAGKQTLLGWFVGQVMREMGGKADPKQAAAILNNLLK